MEYGQPPRTQVGLRKRRRELPESDGLLSTPHPALRATFPSRAGEGKRPLFEMWECHSMRSGKVNRWARHPNGVAES